MRVLEGAAAVLFLGVVAVACGDDAGDAADTGPAENVCESPDDQAIRCVEPGTIIQGSELPATFDDDGCQVREEVKNSCCNPAIVGPQLINAMCCYTFCEGVCC